MKHFLRRIRASAVALRYGKCPQTGSAIEMLRRCVGISASTGKEGHAQAFQQRTWRARNAAGPYNNGDPFTHSSLVRKPDFSVTPEFLLRQIRTIGPVGYTFLKSNA